MTCRSSIMGSWTCYHLSQHFLTSFRGFVSPWQSHTRTGRTVPGRSDWSTVWYGSLLERSCSSAAPSFGGTGLESLATAGCRTFLTAAGSQVRARRAARSGTAWEEKESSVILSEPESGCPNSSPVHNTHYVSGTLSHMTWLCCCHLTGHKFNLY